VSSSQGDIGEQSEQSAENVVLQGPRASAVHVRVLVMHLPCADLWCLRN